MTRIKKGAQQAPISHRANQAHTLDLVVADARFQRDVPVRRPQRKDLYVVLGVNRTATVDEIRKAFQRMALKYHPDKNGDDPVASGIFMEVKFAYSILSDPSKRRQYDISGFEAIESDRQKSDLDLSNLNSASTMCMALLSKLGVPIKTTVPVAILKEALDGPAKVFQLQLGHSEHRKVEKLSAKYYAVDITEPEAKGGLVCRVHSTDQSKFKSAAYSLCSNKATILLRIGKLLYFTLKENGGLDLTMQEDSVDTGNGTSAGMYFLGFTVYRFEHNYSAALTKNSHPALSKMLDSYQSCDVNELNPGTHYFAVYGDNFFYPASYTIEFVSGQSFSAEKEKLQNVEAKILARQARYRQVFAKPTEMEDVCAQDMQTINELLKERNAIHASFMTNNNSPPPKQEKHKTAKDHSMEVEDGDSSDQKTKKNKPIVSFLKKKKEKIERKLSGRKGHFNR